MSEEPMTPPQKQPAVTREEVLDLISDIDECSNCQESDACFVYRRNEMIERLLTERDEAIRERDLAREMLLADQTHASCGEFQKNQQRKLDEAIREVKLLEAATEKWMNEATFMAKAWEDEKRRAAAYREVAINRGCSVCHGTTWDNQRESAVDLEAQKLLADSGGEKQS